MISSVVLAHYEVSRGKDWVSEDCGTIIEVGWQNGVILPKRPCLRL